MRELSMFCFLNGNYLKFMFVVDAQISFVPVIKLDYRGVSLDVLFARLKHLSTIPAFSAPDSTVSSPDRQNAKGQTHSKGACDVHVHVHVHNTPYLRAATRSSTPL